MNRGILLKSAREVWLSTLLVGAGLFVIELGLAYILPMFYDEAAGPLLRVPFIRTMMRALLGAEIGENFGPVVFSALAWVHPLALGLLGIHEIACCTRVPAGEVDRGTIDLLAALPVSRWEIYVTESVVWLLSGLGVLGLGLIGSVVGWSALPPEDRATWMQMLMIISNLLALYTAVGAFALVVSSCCERRGRALAWSTGIVLASFFLNFIAQFWEPAQQVSFLSILHYYQPFEILISGTWPWGDIAVLLGAGALLWPLGGIIFARRDLCAV